MKNNPCEPKDNLELYVQALQRVINNVDGLLLKYDLSNRYREQILGCIQRQIDKAICNDKSIKRLLETATHDSESGIEFINAYVDSQLDIIVFVMLQHQNLQADAIQAASIPMCEH